MIMDKIFIHTIDELIEFIDRNDLSLDQINNLIQTSTGLINVHDDKAAIIEELERHKAKPMKGIFLLNLAISS